MRENLYPTLYVILNYLNFQITLLIYYFSFWKKFKKRLPPPSPPWWNTVEYHLIVSLLIWFTGPSLICRVNCKVQVTHIYVYSTHPPDWKLLWGWSWYFCFWCLSNKISQQYSIQSCIWLPQKCEAMWVLFTVFVYGTHIDDYGISLYIHARN